ncbi:3'-5' exonuclease [Arcobacter sp. FWKO B]|uniref:3'-5' exonuclease n=1 Tax=Arcobacter sp. FWKO B TaxID=2593672 RepID=UPI0018A4820A|nr:3'-5' exonuclease [Arcobacter sp. FWKO B]QOG11410.1 3'-5' exonuclease [Arcobacter sp. FWKO B]
MKHKKNDLLNIIEKLKKQDIPKDEFYEILKKIDTFFENPELEFQLLVSNGLPLEILGDMVRLKTRTTPIKDQKFCIIDIETNGSQVQNGQIIEIAAIKIKNGEIIDSYESLVYAKEIPEYIQEVTSITPCMLKSAPTLKDVLLEFKIFLEDCVFVAHDIKFDYNFISNSLELYNYGKLENRKLCTIDLAKRTIKSERYGLVTLKELLGIDIATHHRAYSDALSTKLVFDECLKNLPLDVVSVEDLIAFSKS